MRSWRGENCCSASLQREPGAGRGGRGVGGESAAWSARGERCAAGPQPVAPAAYHAMAGAHTGW